MTKIHIALTGIALALLLKEMPGAKLAPTHPLMVRIDTGATVLAEEAPKVWPTLDEHQIERRMRVAMAWGWWESRLQADPKIGGNDQGKACGWGQVHPEDFPAGTFPPELTCTAMRTDLRASIRGQLLAIKHFESKCGTLEAALHAYSGHGTCPVSFPMKLVRDRCVDAGLTVHCEMP